MIATQEKTKKIEDFNNTYEIGQIVAYQEDENNLKMTRILSNAFIGGRYGVPCVKLELKKGNFSIDKIKDSAEIKNRKRMNVYKPKYQKAKELTSYYQLKKHIETELENKGFSIVNRHSIMILFAPIKRRWGTIDETKQFQIWLKMSDYKITSYSKNFYKIEPAKK